MEHASHASHACIQYKFISNHISTHMTCNCVGWLVQAWAHRRLKTTSPRWKLIFMLLSQRAKTGDCVGGSVFDPPHRQSLYLGLRLCFQVIFYPCEQEQRGDMAGQVQLTRSVRKSLRHSGWLISCVCIWQEMVREQRVLAWIEGKQLVVNKLIRERKRGWQWKWV